MSNEQTTQQWTQAAASIDAQIAQIEQQIDTAAQQQQANSAQITQLRRQLNSLPLGSAERAAIDRQMVALSDQNNQLSADQAQLSAKLSPLEISLNNATTQATASRSGPPNTSVVPPPATTATTIATTQLVNETPPAAPPKLTVSEQPTTTDTGSPPVQESVFDPRQDPAESVFDSGPTYNGPATEESVFDPRQDVGENVFDPDSAVPSAAVAEAAARINDPYYGLTPEQLKALGGADPTDPYIRARLGIPQLPNSTLNPGGFAAYRPTGVPLIDNAVAAISNFASSLTSFFSPPTKPAVTATGTTTGEPAPAGTNTAAAAADAAAVKQQNTDLTPAQQANLDNIQAANAEVTKAEENIQANNRTILAAEEGIATAQETQRNAEAIIAQNNAELADENLPDDRRAQLEASNAEQYASIAENARYIDETSAVIDGAQQNNQQQQQYIQENQTSVDQSQQAFAADNSDLDAPVDPMEDPQYTGYGSPEYNADVDGPATGTPGEAGGTLNAEDVELGEEERLAAEERLNDSPTLNAEDVELGEEERLAAEERLNDSPTLNAEDVDENQDAALSGELTTPDGTVEGEGDAGTGLQEPTEEDVRAAEEAAAKERTINQATLQSRYKQPGNTDWRVRLALAPTSDYLYNSDDNSILAPLAASNGVIFPYMPQISTAYRANYENYDLVHSNFRGVYYKSSRVDDIQVRGTFTAQDTTEAKYLLAVIHFFRSVTKMFYGKDVERGTPPPLVYLSGLGDYQFSKHPCLVSQFSYTLPNDVDYIRATNPNDYGGNLLNRRTPVQAAPGGINFAGARRLANAITPGGQPLSKGATPQTPSSNSIDGRVNNTGDFSTYVPTMMEIDITLIPVQTRSQVSKQFSLKDFANGNLLKGGFW